MIVVATMVAGGVGAVARVLFGHSGRKAIALINVVGAALLGLVLGLSASGRIEEDLATVLGLGFLGGFTTFSTWMVDVAATSEGRTKSLLAPVGAGVLAAMVGRWLGSL